MCEYYQCYVGLYNAHIRSVTWCGEFLCLIQCALKPGRNFCASPHLVMLFTIKSGKEGYCYAGNLFNFKCSVLDFGASEWQIVDIEQVHTDC